MDIAGYLIAQLSLASPDTPENMFVILGREKVLSAELADRMTGMVRFRNILVHDYLEIDSSIVYEHLDAELSDFDQFAAEITNEFLT